MSDNQTTGERTVVPDGAGAAVVRALCDAASSRPASRSGQLAQPTDTALAQGRALLGIDPNAPAHDSTKPANPDPNDPTQPRRQELASLRQLHDLLLVRKRNKKSETAGEFMPDDTYMARTWPESERLPEDQPTPEKLQKFLYMLEQCGTVYKACVFAGLSTSTIKGLKEDEQFREWCNDAMEAFKAKLHQVALEKAEGWLVPIIGGKFRDEIVGYERKHDSRILELMLKRHDANFRERTEVGVSVTGGVLVVPAPALSQGDWLKANSGEKLPERELIDVPKLPPPEGQPPG